MTANQSSDIIINQVQRDNSEIRSVDQEQGKMLDLQLREKGEEQLIGDHELESKEVDQKLQMRKNEESEYSNSQSNRKKMDRSESQQISGEVQEPEYYSNYTEIVIQQVNALTEKDKTDLQINIEFFDHKTSECIVFMKKNKFGKYEVIKNLDNVLKSEIMEPSHHKNTSYQEEERKNRRLNNAYGKEREIHKVKREKEKYEEPSSEEKDDSSEFSIDSAQGLCENLKRHVNKNPTLTRRQQKVIEKSAPKQEANLFKEESTFAMRKTDKLLKTEQKSQYQHPVNQIPQQYTQDQNKEMQNRNIKNTMKPNQAPIHPMTQMQSVPSMPNNIQLSTNNMGQQMAKMPIQGYPPQMYGQHKVNAGEPGRVSAPYMQYYQPNMMNYGMQMRGIPPKTDDKSKEKPPQFQHSQQSQGYHPMYYHTPYMMHPQMMRSDGSDQRVPMNYPPNFLMQHPGIKPMPGHPQSQGQKMNMYIPYQVDSRYQHFPQYQPYIGKGEQGKEGK